MAEGATHTAVPTERLPLWRPISTTERNWGLALLLTAAFVGVLWLASQAERYAGVADRRTGFVWNASEASARILAVTHTIVATAFLLTSRQVRSRRGVSWLAALAALSVAVCLGWSALVDWSPALSAVLFTGYFIAHDVRDEAFFYDANGDVARAPPANPARPALVVFGAVLLGTLGLAVTLGIGGGKRLMGPLADARLPIRIALAAAVVALLAAATRSLLRRDGIRTPEDWRAYVGAHRPIAVAYALVYAVILFSPMVTDRIYLVVSVHIVLWWVFAARLLHAAKRPDPAPRPLSWRWFRTTPTGFHLLHAAVLALVVVAGAVWAFRYANDRSETALRVLAGKKSFYYWTLVHVTLSWIPRSV